jgi:hypothetical protein
LPSSASRCTSFSLALQQAPHRDARPRRDDGGDVLVGDLLVDHALTGRVRLGTLGLGDLLLERLIVSYSSFDARA